MTTTTPSTPATCSSSEEAAKRAECLRRIEDARTQTREGLAASRRCLADAVEHASSFAHAVDESDRSELMEALQSLEGTLRSAQRRVEERSMARHDSVQLATRASDALRASAQRMAKASASSRLVTLNALINAGHLGDAGAPLSVVATTTGELAREVEHLATAVSEACASLDGLLPELEGVASDMQGHATSLFEHFGPDRAALSAYSAEATAGLRKTADLVHDGLARAVAAGREGQQALGFEPAFEANLDELAELVHSIAA